MKVLITGGAGFIGSHICAELLRAGHEVAVLDNLSSGKRHQVPDGVPFFEVDIRDGVHEVVEQFGPEAVVHQAAQVSVSYSMGEPVFDATTNIVGTIRILEACRDHGVRKVVYASSAASYGEQPTLPLHEDMRPRPVSFYGTSKYTCEHYLRSASREWGIEWAALRYANVYGPRQDPHGEAGVVAIFANLLLDGKQPTIFGGGEATRDYVFVRDIARANRMALEADLKEHPDPVFNASTNAPTSTNRIFELLRKSLGSDIEPLEGPWRRGDVQDSVLDPTKLETTMGWKAEMPLEEGIAETAAFFKNAR